jgi:hypothetical protein
VLEQFDEVLRRDPNNQVALAQAKKLGATSARLPANP